MRKLLIAIVLLLMLIGSFYAALPVIAEYSVRQVLTDHQLNASFDLKRPNLDRIEISQLTLKKETPDNPFTLTAESISIRFNPWHFFSTQRIETLEIKALTLALKLDLTPDDQPSTQDEERSQLSFPPLPSYLFNQLPAEAITLPDVAINIDIVGSPLIRKLAFSGSINTHKDRLALKVNQIAKAPATQLYLTLNNQDQGQLSIAVNQNTVVQSNFNLSADTQQLDVQSQNRLQLEQLKALLEQPLIAEIAAPLDTNVLPDLSGTVTIQGNSLIPLSTPPLMADHRYQITSAATVQNLIPEINRLNVQQDSTLRSENGNFILNIQQLSATGESLNTGGNPAVSAESIRLDLQQPIQLTSSLDQLSQSGIQSIHWPDTELQLVIQPVTIKTQGQPNTLIKTPPVNIKLSALMLAENSVKAELSADNIAVHSGPLLLPLINLHNRAVITPDKITNRFTLGLHDPLLDSEIKITGTSQTEPKTNHSTASWKTSLPLTGIEKLALRFVPQLPPELVFTDGELQHRGWLDQNNSGVALRFLNKVRNTSLSYDQTHLYDINGGSETVKSHRGKLSDTGQLKIAFIDAGVPLENFSGSYRFEQSSTGKRQLQLDSSHVDLLGGTITTLPVTINPDDPVFDSAIAVTGIDLQQLMALEQQQGLTGSGTLNGQMPVSFKQGQLSITDGQINSTPEGGWIRFDPPPAFLAMTQTTPALGIVFDAMRNMKYQSLGIELDYQPDGTALLKTHLKGHNPDWNKSQPVDLTINIEENIPKLLQALQFTDKLTETLEKRYR
ncbi:YdbH domain-containing protein [Amphritea japonica]|uniref:Dicarboxylate transport domain-containing protein n=1 Tax=Amphritea japonica ATCC BAA-1530 TaxID=1278309 RepID=A0A7R6PIH4_9GAMM|nr:YdbH domain-containing protein [Amphritea japonica]BBB27132.1 hypothetical protein AMJAP_2544 [Amphritea japonica ATCC BAA-1530]